MGKSSPFVERRTSVPRTKQGTPPSYRRHSSGQARITLTDASGKRQDHLLGPYGSPESYQEYERKLAEWRARNGIAPPQADPAASDLTVNELLVHWLPFAEK